MESKNVVNLTLYAFQYEKCARVSLIYLFLPLECLPYKVKIITTVVKNENNVFLAVIPYPESVFQTWLERNYKCLVFVK